MNKGLTVHTFSRTSHWPCNTPIESYWTSSGRRDRVLAHKASRMHHQLLLLQQYRLQRVQHHRDSQEILESIIPDKVDMNTTLGQSELGLILQLTLLLYTLQHHEQWQNSRT